MLLEAKDLTILINDGRTWVSTNSVHLRNRFAQPNLRTRIFLLHPESPMLEVLARKVGSTREHMQNKIHETVRMLTELKGEKTKLTILGHYLFNPHALFLGDQYAIMTPYFTARGRRTVPLLRFHDNSQTSFVRKLKDDVRDLENDAKEIQLP